MTANISTSDDVKIVPSSSLSTMISALYPVPPTIQDQKIPSRIEEKRLGPYILPNLSPYQKDLMEAIESSDLPWIINLLYNGVNPNFLDCKYYSYSGEVSCNSPLSRHIDKERDYDEVDLAIAQLLLMNGANPNEKGVDVPIIFQAMRTSPEYLRLVLEKKADPNVYDTEFGMTPIMLAALGNNLAAAKELLLYSNPDLTLKVLEGYGDNYDAGKTAYEIASSKEMKTMLKDTAEEEEEKRLLEQFQSLSLTSQPSPILSSSISTPLLTPSTAPPVTRISKRKRGAQSGMGYDDTRSWRRQRRDNFGFPRRMRMGRNYY